MAAGDRRRAHRRALLTGTGFAARRAARLAAVGLLATGVLTACQESETIEDPACAPAPPPATGSVEGWIGLLAAHRDTVSLRLDPGLGEADPGRGEADKRPKPVEHRSSESGPSASTIKAVHLAAYARAVAEGRLSPDRPVAMSEWERYYFPADGGAHAAALDRLGVPAQKTGAAAIATDQARTVRLDDVVSAMIRESDDAAADLVRELVGPEALDAVLRDAGAEHTEVGSLLGMLLAATHPELAGQGAEELARRYTSDEAFARTVLTSPAADLATQQAYVAEHPPRTSAADLDRVLRAVAQGAAPGADVARRHLEWQPAGPDGVRTGFKGGSLPGMVGIGFESVRADGSAATGALLVSGLDEPTWTAAQTDPSWQQLVLRAVDDPQLAGRLRCALTGRP